MKKFFRIISLILSGVTLLGMVPTVTAADAVTATADDKADAEWEEVQKIVSQYYGEWTDTIYLGAVNDRIPDTALLGNGDVGVSSYGNEKTKTFNISKGDFWEYNNCPLALGAISVGNYVPVDKGNLVPDNYKNVTASSSDDSVSSPEMAVNGMWRSNGAYQGWVSQHSQREYWMVVEFKEAITFDRWVVRNDNAARPGNKSYNTKACEIQISENGTAWTTISSVSNNKADVIKVYLDKEYTSKWVRLLVTDPTQGDDYPRARIGAFELYNDEVEYGVDMATSYVSATASSSHENYTPDKAVDGEYSTGSFNGWTTAIGPTHWMMLDMGRDIEFNRWILRNDGINNAARITKDCQIQYWTGDGVPTGRETTGWVDADAVSGNSAKVIDRVLSSMCKARYIRLYITGPNQATSEAFIREARAAILAFELYNMGEGYAPEEDQQPITEYNTNLALKSKGVVATADSYFNSGTHPASLTIDGSFAAWQAGNRTSDYDHWASHNSGKDHWLQLEFPARISFNRWVVYNAGAGKKTPVENYANNTDDCELQISDDGSTWETVSIITDNTDDVMDITLEKNVSAKFVRLYITRPRPVVDPGERARICAFEIYNMNDNPPQAPETEPETDPETKPGETIDFYEKMDILNAEVITQQQLAGIPMQIESWMSATNNLFVMKITSLSEETTADISVNLAGFVGRNRPNSSEVGDDYILVTRSSVTGNWGHLNDIYENIPYISKVAMATKVVGVEGMYQVDNNANTIVSMKLPAGESVYVVTAVCGGGRTYTADGKLWDGRTEPAQEALALLDTVNTTEDVETLHTAHLNWWKDYWMQSYISLDTSDEDLATLQKYYYAAQYIAGSGIRAGSVAPGLYAIWHTTDTPQWHSDYHLNYNFISTFYGFPTSNRTSMVLPAVEAIMDYLPQGVKNAGSLEQLRAVAKRYPAHIDRLIELGKIDPEKGIENAILYPVAIGPYGMTVENNSYLGETLDAAFSVYPLVEYYNFTQDKEFMEDTLYVYIEHVLNFLEAWLVKEDGEYVLYAGYNEGSWARNACLEIMTYKMCLKYGIQIATELGDTEKAAKWQEIYENMADQPVVENFAPTGKPVLGLAEEYLSSDDKTWLPMNDLIGGNVLALESIVPFEIFGYYSSDEDLEIIKNTIDAYGSVRNAWQNGNSFPKIFVAAVNSRYDCRTIVSEFANTIRKQMKANMRIDDGGHGIEKVGATEAINNMMLMIDQGVIKLFGNWLEDKDAKFARLRASGAFVFSAEYDGDTKEIAEGATIYSEAGATATVASLWDEGMIVLDENGKRVKATKGTAPNHDDEITYTFATEAGKTYTFVKGSNVSVSGVTLDKTEATLTKGESLQLTATVAPENADDVTVSWSSSNEEVATVDQSGNVTAVGIGDATITVTTADGNKTATCVVTVTSDDATTDGETTTTPDGETTVIPDGETTVTPDAETTATPAGDATDAPEEGTAGADATAGETTAAEASGCKASVGAGIAAAALIVAAGAVVLKKKED